jgi:trehalose 6-phosphate phosphatase
VSGLQTLRDALSNGPAGLATDFDGTISQIVSPPEAAVPLPGAEESLRRLVGALEVVALVSGRAVADLAERIRVPGAVYIGLHGLEWWRPSASEERARRELAFAPSAEEAARLIAVGDALRASLGAEQGVRIEDKGLGVAVHYRDTPDPLEMRPRILDICRDLAASEEEAKLALREGKLFVELGLAHGTNKGTALRRLVQERGLRSMVFFGDDLTDLDGFSALADLRQEGIVTACAVVVTPDAPHPLREAGDVVLSSPRAAVELLGQLADAFA